VNESVTATTPSEASLRLSVFARRPVTAGKAAAASWDWTSYPSSSARNPMPSSISILKRNRGFAIVAALFAALAAGGCGNDESSSGARPKAGVKAAERVAEAKVPPYAYAAPVKGHIKEVKDVNIGAFDLVDGIAYPALTGAGTVVYVASKPIVSPMLVESACPLSLARALSKLRNASFAEVTLDVAGRSKYFAAGTPFGGSLADFTLNGWSSTLKSDAGRVVGKVQHRQYGRFEFDLPLSNPKFDEMSYGDREQKRRLAAATPTPAEQAVTAAYVTLRDAALRKDLKATLSALGFDARQIAAIRGMDGIDADFLLFADRFVAPGATGDASTRPGSGHVRGEGLKANGKKYFNDYYFDLCGDRLVLTGIVEQSP
jgi:hypothetical protein